MHERQAVLIDTDIGDDVDDAFALALATQLPALRLLGVTTVCGPVAQRAQIARLVLCAAGQPHVAVAVGSSTMRDGRPGSAKLSHAPLLAGSAPAPTAAPRAVALIGACAAQVPQLTIIALGPLTNIAAALDCDPTLAQRARLVAMAGTLGVPYPDWNLRCDPAAARRVLGSGLPTTLVGMHVTMRCKLRPAQMRRLFADARPLARILARCVLAWRSVQRRMPILHDALTVAVAADATLVRQELRRVGVGRWGFSWAARSGTPNARVCTSVDLPRFHALLDATLLGGALREAMRR